MSSKEKIEKIARLVFFMVFFKRKRENEKQIITIKTIKNKPLFSLQGHTGIRINGLIFKN